VEVKSRISTAETPGLIGIHDQIMPTAIQLGSDGGLELHFYGKEIKNTKASRFAPATIPKGKETHLPTIHF